MSDTNNAPALVDATGAPVQSAVQDGPHGPFLPEQWEHLKAWVRREMEMFEHGISRDQREVGNQ